MSYGMNGWNKEIPGGDTISRAAAIDAICNSVCGSKFCGLPCDDVAALKALPSAQPERKKGRWIEREVTHIDDLEAKDIITAWQSCKCSVCGRYDTKPYMYYFNAPKYCSWCGAEMEVSE